MKKFDTQVYLNSLYDQLLNKCEIQKIEVTRAWASNFPSEPGVYVFRDNTKIIYVCETGNLRGRMKDMIDTRNHVLRRSMGNKIYREVKGFEPATSKRSL